MLRYGGLGRQGHVTPALDGSLHWEPMERIDLKPGIPGLTLWRPAFHSLKD